MELCSVSKEEQFNLNRHLSRLKLYIIISCTTLYIRSHFLYFILKRTKGAVSLFPGLWLAVIFPSGHSHMKNRERFKMQIMKGSIIHLKWKSTYLFYLLPRDDASNSLGCSLRWITGVPAAGFSISVNVQVGSFQMTPQVMKLLSLGFLTRFGRGPG